MNKLQQLLAAARDKRLRDRPTTQMQYQPGDILHREGDEAHTLYTVRSGVVVHTRIGADGEELSMGISIAGELFGDEFAAEGLYLSTSTALSEVTVNAIGYDRLTPDDLPYLLSSLSERYKRMVEHQAHMATSSVKVRVCEVLTRLLSSDLTVAKEDGLFAVNVTPTTLALLTHSRRESVTKALSELKREDVLITGHNSLVVMDALRLVEVAEGFGE